MLGTVSQTVLYYLKQLTLLNHDLINFGNIKIWFVNPLRLRLLKWTRYRLARWVRQLHPDYAVGSARTCWRGSKCVSSPRKTPPEWSQSLSPTSANLCNHQYNQSVNQSINQSVSQSFHQSINQSINQSIKKSINQSINQSISQSVSQSISQSVVYFRGWSGWERMGLPFLGPPSLQSRIPRPQTALFSVETQVPRPEQ